MYKVVNFLKNSCIYMCVIDIFMACILIVLWLFENLSGMPVTRDKVLCRSQ